MVMSFNCIVLADIFKLIFLLKKMYFFYNLFLVIPQNISKVIGKSRISTEFSGLK